MNLSLTIDLYFAGTSEGAKKAWDVRGRNPMKAPAEKIGRTTLAYNLNSAVDTIINQLKAHSRDWVDPKNAIYMDKWVEDVRKNWTRGMRGAFEGKFTSENLENIRKGIAYNEKNPLYQSVVDR